MPSKNPSHPRKYRKNYAHHAIYHLMRPFLRLVYYLKFGFYTENKLSRRQLRSPFIMVSNHISYLDSMLVAAALPRHAYFMATEDLLCHGFKSRCLKTFVGPIPLFKADMSTVPVREALRRLRGGDSIMLFPEGHHSPDGLTTDVKDSIGALVKAGRCSLVTFKLIGGFYMSPRWCASRRRGPVRSRFVNVYPPEELAKMSSEEITALINGDIAEDAVARQAVERHKYKSDSHAETLEVHYYICPVCGALRSLHSRGDEFWCDSCSLRATVNEYGDIVRTDGTDPFPHPHWTAWNDWQLERESELLDQMQREGGCFCDDDVELLEYRHAEFRSVSLARGSIRADLEGLSMPEAGLYVKWQDLPWINYNRCARALQFVLDGHHYELYGYTLCAYRYGSLFFRAKGIKIRY